MPFTRPPALRPGDRVGVCAPAGPVNPDRLSRGAAELRSLGFEVQVSEGALARRFFTAGSAERRLEELHGLFADESVRGVFCARGGAGAFDLLPQLDVELLRGHPKVFVGYSDVTCLHVALNQLGLVTFHGPMVARELCDGAYDRRSLLAGISGGADPYASEPDELLPLRPGAAEATLLGGCLSLLASACGTPWALPASDDCILFLEDVNEAPYRVDRMLRQLRAAGAFERVRGVVLGDFPGCSPPLEAGFALQDVILDALAGLEVPVALGLSSGHTHSPHVTLPLGVPARLRCDAETARFEVLEASVA